MITGRDLGIGRALAVAFALEGADVLISYLDDFEDKDAEDIAEIVRQCGRKAVLAKGDFRKEAHCKDMVGKAISEFGQIINNVAFQMARKTLQDIPSEEGSSGLFFSRFRRSQLYCGGNNSCDRKPDYYISMVLMNESPENTRGLFQCPQIQSRLFY